MNQVAKNVEVSKHEKNREMYRHGIGKVSAFEINLKTSQGIDVRKLFTQFHKAMNCTNRENIFSRSFNFLKNV